MSDSDLLAIQLFIGATAIAAAAVAVTAAGWTHRYFIRAMSLLTAVLALCALFYRSIVEMLPVVGRSLELIAGNSVAWFIVFGLTIISILVLDFAARVGWFRKEDREDLTEIAGKSFRDEIVVIDGKFFNNCTFRKVTIRYRGGHFHFTGSKFRGVNRFETQHDTAIGTVKMLKLMDLLSENFAQSWNPNLPREHFQEEPN